MEIYHGSTVIVKQPEIRIEKYNKDFYFGFYCTLMEQQAIRWATRFGEGIVNVYEYEQDDSLKILKFEKMTEEWLDFIIACRSGTLMNGILLKVRWQTIPFTTTFRNSIWQNHKGSILGISEIQISNSSDLL